MGENRDFGVRLNLCRFGHELDKSSGVLEILEIRLVTTLVDILVKCVEVMLIH